MKQYDLIVLGTGNAGYQVAMECKKAGWSVAIVNDGLAGGVCAVRGCIPKKVLAGVAEIADINRRLGELGIVTEQPVMSWAELIKFKRTFTGSVPSETETALRDAGVDFYQGTPHFTGNLQLEINGEQLAAKKIHIAVGAKPVKLPIEGFEHLITSDEFLELDHLPRRIVFVGGGYVSFEFAHIAARFGADVTILHSNDRPLPMFDWDIIQVLMEATKEVGIKIALNAGVQKIEKHEGVYVVTTVDGRRFETDLVVHGAGRQPAIADLNLEATGVEYDEHRGVSVNEYLQSTSNPAIYSAGDATVDGPALSSVAGVQGAVVADNLLGKSHKQPSYLSTPSVIFATPPVARVGYLEQEARDRGIDIDVITTDLTGWFDSMRFNLKHAKSKLIIEKTSGKIIGAHLIHNRADDLINMFALAIEMGLTAQQFKSPIYAFPTISDDARYML